MSITSSMCNTFKQELLGGVHDLDTDTLKLALIKGSPSGTYGSATTNYSDLGSDEASGAGYSAGGTIVSGASITLDGATAFADFSDVTFEDVSVNALGCLLYNSSKSNKAIAVLTFTTVKKSINADFVVSFPTADSSNAIIRIT